MPVLARMEEAGVKLDCEVLAEMSRRLERDINSKAREIYDKSGFEFNINSPKQLGDVLFNKLNLPKPIKYGKGKTISTAVDVLEGLAAEHEVPRMVLDYRQLSKLKSTYVDALPALLNSCTQRLHTTFNMAGSATGRLSSVNPNLQNIPIRTELGREIRAAFVAEPGHVLLKADYSQIELRLLAHFSGDKLLVEAYRTGEDIHTLTASQVFGVPPLMVDAEHRRRAKAVNFGIVYGLSPFGLSQQIGIDTKEAKRFIDAYFEKYSGVREFIDRTLEQARRDQKVSTLFGRVRPIPDIHSKNFNLRGFAERTAVNTPLQGTAADLIKLAMIRIDAELRERKLRFEMLLQVHDELVFEVPEEEVDTIKRLVVHQMEHVHELKSRSRWMSEWGRTGGIWSRAPWLEVSRQSNRSLTLSSEQIATFTQAVARVYSRPAYSLLWPRGCSFVQRTLVAILLASRPATHSRNSARAGACSQSSVLRRTGEARFHRSAQLHHHGAPSPSTTWSSSTNPSPRNSSFTRWCTSCSIVCWASRSSRASMCADICTAATTERRLRSAPMSWMEGSSWAV